MNPTLLRSTWAEAQTHDRFVVHFYSHLSLIDPDARSLFPAHMAAQRRKLVEALCAVVAAVDDLDQAVPMLQELGRRHVAYGATTDHYRSVGTALLATFAHFLGDAWTADAETTWAQAYGIVAKVMIDAAAHIDPVEGGRHG